ncbi:MAG TPA: transcription factor FapR [Paenibacillaceae bacterium]|nr:transcription factor FapR [Paenibacillaceae bacterium]
MIKVPRLSKKVRQKMLNELLEEHPFYTDEELAARFQVSIQTIRLDRLELGIPELRERIKNVAQQSLGDLKSLTPEEVVGEMVDVQLDHSAISIMEITEEHVFSRTKIARGHHIFAQANSLAVAVIDADMVLTAAARIRYVRPVSLGEKLVAKAIVRSTDGEQSKVRVETRIRDELVFTGTFRVLRIKDFAAE